jgi:glycine cleavage system H protein
MVNRSIAAARAPGWVEGDRNVVTLIFVAVLLTAVAIDFLLIRPWERRHLPDAPGDTDASLEFVVPRTLFFDLGHTWARLDEDELVTVGLDDLARTLIGEISSVELPSVGARLTAGQPAFGVRQGTRRLDFASPVSGTVTEINPALGRDPIRLRWRPYKEGWALRLAPGDRLSAELGGLVIGRDAQRWMLTELDRLESLFERGVLSPPVEGALQRAGDDAWPVFERDVLKTEGRPVERLA